MSVAVSVESLTDSLEVVLGDEDLIRVLASHLNGGEICAIINHLVRGGYVDTAAIYAVQWAECDEDAEVFISADRTSMTVETDSEKAVVTDPRGILRHLRDTEEAMGKTVFLGE